MCGRYGFTYKSKKEVQERYDISNIFNLDQSYNIAPSQKALIVTRNSPNKAEVRAFGIKAPWKEGMLLINAQSETVNEKRTFAKMFKESRCLIPATFFFEWKKLKDGKQPYAFKIKNDEMFAFAGIYNDDGFVILTTAPSDIMEDVHNRQPLILSKIEEEIWLNPDSDEDQLMKLFKPTQGLVKWPISSLVNKPQNNFPEILKEI